MWFDKRHTEKKFINEESKEEHSKMFALITLPNESFFVYTDCASFIETDWMDVSRETTKKIVCFVYTGNVNTERM